MPRRATSPRRESAGILLWRRAGDSFEVLIGHPGGPYFVRKDAGHWSLPKGEIEPGEQPIDVARREFEEETGHPVPDGPMLELGEIRQKGGKFVVAWAVQGDLDPSEATSNTFEVEWPPGSGTLRAFPEIDRVAWFALDEARRTIKPTQIPFIDRLEAALASGSV
jgi:predicted NUDIX family NTP pyrophosphohydrolase